MYIFSQRILHSIRPSRDWGPALNINRQKANYRLLAVNLGGPIPFDDLPSYEDQHHHHDPHHHKKSSASSLRGSFKKLGSHV